MDFYCYEKRFLAPCPQGHHHNQTALNGTVNATVHYVFYQVTEDMEGMNKQGGPELEPHSGTRNL